MLMMLTLRGPTISVEEKGGITHKYHISKEGLDAIQKYLVKERPMDFEKWKSPALFLSTSTNPRGNGRFTVKVMNSIWNEICTIANVEGKTPHSASHAMGKHIIKKNWQHCCRSKAAWT